MKIRILYTIPNFDTAGSGLPLLKIAASLDANYFEPQIACLHDRGELFQDIRESGIKVHLIDLYKNARPIIKMLKECYQLSKVFKKINPNIIHSYNYSSDYTEPLAAKMAGIKWIYTKKNMSWRGPSYRGWKLRSWLADGIICQNSDMLKDFFPSWRKVKLIPIGVDTEEYSLQPKNINVKKKWGISDNDRIIITVANLVPVKGVEVLIEAFELLFNSHPSWKLMIVGDATTEYGIKLINKYLKNRDLKDKIIFTGKQKNVRELLDLSEIYVQSTLNKGRMEGAPIAIQEAMTNGKVVIGSDIPGIRDQLEEFRSQLFKAGDYNELYKKLVFHMSNNIVDNIEFGRKFVNIVKNRYDISIEKEKIEAYYRKLLD